MDVVAEVDDKLVAEVLALMTGIPVTDLSEDDAQRLLRMEDELHKRVIGQQHGHPRPEPGDPAHPCRPEGPEAPRRVVHLRRALGRGKDRVEQDPGRVPVR